MKLGFLPKMRFSLQPAWHPKKHPKFGIRRLNEWSEWTDHIDLKQTQGLTVIIKISNDTWQKIIKIVR